MCNKGFIWNPSNCECEYDKASDIGEYLDYENCKCRKKSVYQIIDECTESVEEVKLAKITVAVNERENKYSSCTVYTVLMIVAFTIFTGITTFLFITIGLWLKIIFLALNLVLTKKQRLGKHINGGN